MSCETRQIAHGDIITILQILSEAMSLKTATKINTSLCYTGRKLSGSNKLCFLERLQYALIKLTRSILKHRGIQKPTGLHIKNLLYPIHVFISLLTLVEWQTALFQAL